MLRINNQRQMEESISQQIKSDYCPDLYALKISYLRYTDKRAQTIIRLMGKRPDSHLIGVSEAECNMRVNVAMAELNEEITSDTEKFQWLQQPKERQGKFLRVDEAEVALLPDGDEGAYIVAYATHYGNLAQIVTREATLRTLLTICHILSWSYVDKSFSAIVEKLSYDTVDEQACQQSLKSARTIFEACGRSD